MRRLFNNLEYQVAIQFLRTAPLSSKVDRKSMKKSMKSIMPCQEYHHTKIEEEKHLLLTTLYNPINSMSTKDYM